MKKIPGAALLVLTLTASAQAQTRGPLVAVGGGGTTDAIVARTLKLAGGKTARVVVLPQSSELEGAGDSSVKMWLDAGAAEARKVDFTAPDARTSLERATLIWIPGGDQNRFMKSIDGTGLAEVIAAANRKGAVVGGTSAGAAVLSEWMITGDADLAALTAGKTVLAKGLALWPAAIVDQHFLRRQRHNRLLSAVLDRPTLIGVGVDEGTAVFLIGERLDVTGSSAVVVVDARNANVEKLAPGAVSAATNLKVSVLRDGMSIPLK